MDVISFAYQISSALVNLHYFLTDLFVNAGISLQSWDCPSRSCLFLKITETDFGMSHKMDEIYIQKHVHAGRVPLKWMAIKSVTVTEFTFELQMFGYCNNNVTRPTCIIIL